jgi:uncharacterized surface protein with fasciclin (FAS1) repeats
MLRPKLNIFEGLTVQGQSLDENHMYDAMELESMAGYPLTIMQNPFRVNNVIITRNELEPYMQYKNGVVHRLLRYPKPLVPWIGKSTFDVLLEANEWRGGDLSEFLELIESFPAIKFDLMHGLGSKGLTIFAPTNYAMATLDPSMSLGPNLQHLLRNHLVSGNVVLGSWSSIETGRKIGNNEILIESEAGQGLSVRSQMEKGDFTVNGNVLVVQKDLFSEQGVLHVVGMPLLFAT